MNKSFQTNVIKNKLLVTLGIGMLLPVVAVSSVYAATGTVGANISPGSNTTAAKNLVSTIITKGNTEITRRLTTLNTLDTKISSSTKISDTDKTTLTNEVNNEISGLTALKTTLDACVTTSCAKTAAASIFTEYRVYALVVPQVDMIRTADNQQLTEAKLSTIAGQIGTRLSASSNNSSTLQADLTAMKGYISSAQSLSANVETSVAGYTPANFDSNHSLLVQDYDNLKTAQADIQAADSQGRTIVKSLK